MLTGADDDEKEDVERMEQRSSSFLYTNLEAHAGDEVGALCHFFRWSELK